MQGNRPVYDGASERGCQSSRGRLARHAFTLLPSPDGGEPWMRLRRVRTLPARSARWNREAAAASCGCIPISVWSAIARECRLRDMEYHPMADHPARLAKAVKAKLGYLDRKSVV